MAFTSAQTTVYSAILSSYVQKNLVFKNATNFTWEPDAQRAKVVTINALTAPTVYTFSPGQGIISGSDVAYTSQNLTLDQYKYFNISVDDTLRAQSNVVTMDPILRAGGYELAQAQDAYIASLWSSISTTNWIQSGSSFLVNRSFTETASSGSAYDCVVNLSVKLDESHAPKQDRFVIAPSWFVNDISKDTRFASFDANVRATGVMGSVAGLTVLQSENVVNANSIYNVMALQKEGIAFASGLESVEMLRSENTFATKLRGLAVYGAKVLVDTYGAVAFVKKG